MRYFPMFLDLAGREVLIAGGGEQAAQKLRLLARTEARITVMAPEVLPEIAASRAEHLPVERDPAAVARAALAFLCTGSEALDELLAAEVRAAGGIVNVVDRPALCDAITPALVDRDPLVIAIGSEGAAPVLARQVKTALETMLEPGLGRLVAAARDLRGRVAETVPEALRRRFWAWVFDGPPRRMFREGREAEAVAAMRAAAEAGEVPGAGGALTVIALPEAPDLLTLRAVQRLQEADLILHGEPAPDGVLELARRDAERGPLDAGAARAATERGGRVVILGEAEMEGAERL